MIQWGNIPIGQLLHTHVSRSPLLLEQGIDLVWRGGSIDLNPSLDESRTLLVVETLRDSGIDLTRITFSSDDKGTQCRFDEEGGLVGYGIGEVSTLGEAFRAIVGSGTLSLTEALRLFTSNPADILGLSDRKRTG